ncbi:sigma-70 family RNA polymerase sigma factor [Bacillus sp. FJAT-49736]|uniref:sigma-70 family RNA polymerase sigma factor n=1 Tax=Bacillus sp. FJAT-49736 TaxID=2833582 RepID=UPI001BC950EC|nr:sigma-70 family RNA polymerase sigma factor [Bacillus sp. FJAT-49736]MBS4172796.1 sigma-70 family RNA polymerase sigma factor [Bacillus sp. FJAT-49736]
MEKSIEIQYVKEAMNGDVNAYSLLVKKYSNATFATAIGIVKDPHIAQDLAQEALVKAWFQIGKLTQADKFSSWLYIITKRQCVDWIRKKKITEPIEHATHLYDERNNVEAVFYENYLKESIWNAINQLDEPKRIVTILYFISGFTIKEVSEYLNISMSAVESRIRRAKEKLKKELFEFMETKLSNNTPGKRIHEETMWRIVPRIATIEIPVSNIQASIEWYHNVLGTKVVHQSDHDAMLHLQGGNRVGVPTLYLVQTNSKERLTFENTNTKIVHSVIDFFIPDLNRYHSFLKNLGVEVTDINYLPGMENQGGFGFKDPDGNVLSACNVTHLGQE